MDLPIRPAEARDLETLRRLMSGFHAESGHALDPERAGAALGELLADRRLGRLWIVRSGEETARYVAVCFGFSLEYEGRDAFVDDLYRRPAFRGSGLGTRVLEAVEAECRSLGVRALHLEVARDNRVAQRLYRRRGFRDNDRQLLTKRLLEPVAPDAEPPGPGAARRRRRGRCAAPPDRADSCRVPPPLTEARHRGSAGPTPASGAPSKVSRGSSTPRQSEAGPSAHGLGASGDAPWPSPEERSR